MDRMCLLAGSYIMASGLRSGFDGLSSKVLKSKALMRYRVIRGPVDKRRATPCHTHGIGNVAVRFFRRQVQNLHVRAKRNIKTLHRRINAVSSQRPSPPMEIVFKKRSRATVTMIFSFACENG